MKRIRGADIPHHHHSRTSAKLPPRGDPAPQPPPPPAERARWGSAAPGTPFSVPRGRGLVPYLPSPLLEADPRSAPRCAAACPPRQVCLKRPPLPTPPHFPTLLLSLPPSLPPSLSGKKPAAPRAMESLALPTCGGRRGGSPSAAPGPSEPPAAPPHLGEVRGVPGLSRTLPGQHGGLPGQGTAPPLSAAKERLIRRGISLVPGLQKV